jgi:hypothetical protein
MGKETRRSAAMRRMLEEWEASGLTRRAFCLKRGIPVTTFDYWRREHAGRSRVVKVEVAAAEAAAPNFTLLLANGRRIECSSLADEELARLIRIAERA